MRGSRKPSANSSSWFIKIAGDVIAVAAAPVDRHQNLSTGRYPLPSPFYQSRVPGNRGARVRTLQFAK